MVCQICKNVVQYFTCHIRMYSTTNITSWGRFSIATSDILDSVTDKRESHKASPRSTANFSLLHTSAVIWAADTDDVTYAMTARRRPTGSRNYSPASTQPVSLVQVPLRRQLRESADNFGCRVSVHEFSWHST